ncbi:MAG TPA: hypothetical protein VNB54_14895, partial [Alphaproteobacteria bacterium]|nr:hypothetical protein [Alphaproteobacteria bacterium]
QSPGLPVRAVHTTQSFAAKFRDGQLVAWLIGCRHDLRRRLPRVMRGEAIGYKEGNDESPD